MIELFGIIEAEGEGDSRIAVRQLVVALVGLHGQLEVALLTGEAGLVPDLWEGAGQGSGQSAVKGLNE